MLRTNSQEPTTSRSFYVTGGTLQPNAPSYVERQADRDLYNGLSRGDFCYVLTARQMGKSSLMARTAQRLREEGVTVVVLDLTAIGQNLSPEQWYDGLRWLLGQQLGLDDELDDFWLAHERLGPLQRWLAALELVVLAQTPGPTVIFVEEVDTVLSLPFSTDEFFAGIRECYNRRVRDPEFHRLTFCLLGVASPSDLIRDTRTTPFNIGRRIELTDFSETDAAPLAQGLTRKAPIGSVLLKRVLYWTGGHPYLTQRLCQAIADDASVTEPAGVDRLCRELFLSPRAREQDDNLLFVRERMLKSEADLASLLDLYAQVSRGKRVPDDETNPLVSLLRLSGISRAVEGRLRVRNRIYERVFDGQWIGAHMPDAELRRQRAAYRRGLARATFVSGVILAVVAGLALVALDQARRANRERRVAQDGQRTLRRTLYASQMKVAQQSWEEGNLEQAREMLRAQRPTPGLPAGTRSQEDLRGFEWRYLWRLCQQSDARFTLHGHADWVGSLTFSPDGAILASGSGDHTVKLWDVASKRKIATLQGHKDGINRVVFSPDGRTLASASADRTVKLWNVASCRAVATLEGHKSNVRQLAFSPDGARLSSGSVDWTLKQWDVASHKEVASAFLGQKWWLEASAFSPDGNTLAVGSANAVLLWDVPTRRVVGTLPGKTRRATGWPTVTKVAFSPDGKTLALASLDNAVRLWDVKERKELSVFQGHTDRIFAMAFSPDGTILATGGVDHMVKLWDLVTRRERNTLRGHLGAVGSIVFSPDGHTLATGGADGTIKLWDAGLEPRFTRLPGHKEGVPAVAFSPDGRLLASGGDDTTVRLWDVGTERAVAMLRGHTQWVHGVAFAPDGKTLATGSLDGTVKLWDVASRRQVATLRVQSGRHQCVAFSPDGRMLAIGGWPAVQLWNVATRQHLATLRGSPEATRPVAFSPDGRLLATGSMDGSAKLWDVATKQEWAVLKGPSASRYVQSVAFSPDGRIVAVGGYDSTATLWDTARRQRIALLKGHPEIVDAVAFSPDGRTLAASGAGNTIKLWNLATLQEVASLRGHTSVVWSLAFSADGQTLASGSADATVRLWRAATFAETDTADGAHGYPSSKLDR